MKLTSHLDVFQKSASQEDRSQRALRCARTARQFEKAGEYEAAYEALSEFWPEPPAPPLLDGLDPETKAELLLRVGAVAGWIGGSRQGLTQEMAKNLITRSFELFERLGKSEKEAEARSDLALCYWREGAFDEARINLQEALIDSRENSDLKAIILIRSGIVEHSAKHFNAALRFYREALPLVDRGEDPAIKGPFHLQLGILYNRLAKSGNNDYPDKALIEFAAARFHFEQAGHARYTALTENNLAILYTGLGKFVEAHEHLDQARKLLVEINDRVHLAQLNDTEARTLLAEGRIDEAERFALAAVKILEKGDEQDLLAESLTTHGVTLARLGHYRQSRERLLYASRVAETVGHVDRIGRAKLSIIEELFEHTSAAELAAIYKSAAECLESSDDPESEKRLIAAADRVIAALDPRSEEVVPAKNQSWKDFSLKDEILKREKKMIERALREASGSVTQAARLLGFKHHQNLISLINSQHRDLLIRRSAIRKRRRPLLANDEKKPLPSPAPEMSILYVHNNRSISRPLEKMAALENWRLEVCRNLESAQQKLDSQNQYDLLIIDDDPNRLSGLELVQTTRKTMHRRRTPIIMLSNRDCETEAWRAGVDAFLRKPAQPAELTGMIARLLKIDRANN